MATEVYVFGYPLVLMELTRRLETNTVEVSSSAAPTNQLLQHAALATPETKEVVRPNVDTLYTQAWLDLTAEPMVLEVPVMDEGRYWLMEILDAWTNVVGDPSSINPLAAPVTDPATGAEVYSYALTGPDWQGELPDGVHQLPMPTNTVWLLGRTEVFDDSQAEIQTVNGYQDLMRLLPVSAWPNDGSYDPPDGTYDPDLPTAPPSDQLNVTMSGPEFFKELAALLTRTPLNPQDPWMSAALRDLGVFPYDPAKLPSDERLELAKNHGLVLIKNHKASEPVNGWTFTRTDIGYYGLHYLQRAYIAAIGLGANLPEDALYPSISGAAADSTGAPLRYTLTFPAGQLPPVDAFWSLTAYDSDSFLVENPDDIYAIGHYTPPLADPVTGATTLYVQAEPPADAALQTANWLPIPTSGNFSVTLRLYAPRTDDIPASWPPPLVQVKGRHHSA
ncbi:DUF1254 domain-containing protein [Streptomyces sp. 1114.5]|uniref:DUF1254 domain-containing protein n=1 Tax=Streptomyces sp. 1114.5 TaxID=1938830 RepID=UPI0015FECE1E|nr:DUF1254 domain-containing protein [Streptomyces sp. 1114.5]